VQGQMVAEIWVQRGTTYRLQSYGGINHPLYVTSEPVGGFIEKPFSEQAGITNFAGERAEGVGSLCEYKPSSDHRAANADSFETFDEYRHYLNEECEPTHAPGILMWHPDQHTPNIVYYASYSTFNMAGPIRVCNRISGTVQNPKCEQ